MLEKRQHLAIRRLRGCNLNGWFHKREREEKGSFLNILQVQDIAVNGETVTVSSSL
jgi:flagellar biosynthesis/type III secretory pathway chaperone